MLGSHLRNDTGSGCFSEARRDEGLRLRRFDPPDQKYPVNQHDEEYPALSSPIRL